MGIELHSGNDRNDQGNHDDGVCDDDGCDTADGDDSVAVASR